MLLQFDQLLRRDDDVIQTLMRCMSNDEIVNDDWSNNHRVNQSDSWETSFSRERDQSWKCRDLCDHFLLYVSKMRISFQFIVNLHTQDAYVIKRLFYDVADFYRRLHVEFRDVFRQMYQFIFNRRKDDFVTTISQQTVFVHFLQQSIIVDRVNVVNENVDVIHKIDDNHFTRRLLKKFEKIRIVKQISYWWHWWFLEYVDVNVAHKNLLRFHDKIDSLILQKIVCSSNDSRRNSFLFEIM